MNTQTLIATIVLAVGSLSAGIAVAQPLEGEAAAHYLGVLAGVTSQLQDTSRFDAKALVNGQFIGGVPIDAATGIEVNTFFNGGGHSPRVAGGGLDLVLRDPDGRPGLLLLAGFGVQKRNDASGLLPYVDFGAGLSMPMGPRLRLRSDARLYALREPRLAQGKDLLFEARLNVGLEFAWQAPFERMGATGCGSACTAVAADADGDGVPDKRDQCPATPVGLTVDAAGCPLRRSLTPPPLVIRSLPKPVCPAVKLASLQFDVDGCLSAQTADVAEISFHGTQLTAAGAIAVDQLALALQASPELALRVLSHVDAEGDMALREHRAQLVRDRLVGRGVAPGRLDYAAGDNQGERIELRLRRVDAR